MTKQGQVIDLRGYGHGGIDSIPVPLSRCQINRSLFPATVSLFTDHQMESFAEETVANFVKNDSQPAIKPQLRSFDRKGYRMVETA